MLLSSVLIPTVLLTPKTNFGLEQQLLLVNSWKKAPSGAFFYGFSLIIALRFRAPFTPPHISRLKMLKHLIALTIFVLSANLLAAETSGKAVVAPNKMFIDGRHFQILDVPLSPMGGPVVEFMYFGCETCYKLAPAISQWSYSKKIDVVLVPVHSESAMVDEARIFHTFELAGALDKMYEEGFILVQTKDSKLQGADRINEALDRNGVDKASFWGLWRSDAVKKRLEASAALTKQAKIMKTPTFVVHGRYKVDIESVKSVEELFELLEYLVAKKPASAPALLKKAS